MIKKQAHTMNLDGSNHEIGNTLGRMAGGIPPLKQYLAGGFKNFGGKDAEQARSLFSEWCPGLNDELDGFAEALGTAPENVVYYAMTYLRPRCSQMVLMPGITASGHPLVARNYEFNHNAEDFTLVKTSAAGRYSHLGTSVLFFGREDGVNEWGLSVTMSSCGMPVGAMPEMRNPKVTGLMFWAVIRSLLENCRDVDEALSFLKGMPIAFNINLLLADKNGAAALVETMDGSMATKRIGPGSSETFMCATNHIVLPELVHLEPSAMRNSLKRYDFIVESIKDTGGNTPEKLKGMLLAKYPEGLCCHYFNDYFGTTKSMVIDPVERSVEICWGGRAENGWNTYRLADPMENSTREIELNIDKLDPGLFQFVPIAHS